MIFLVILPFLAALVYLIARGSSMAERRATDMRQMQAQNDEYIRSVAGSGGGSAASEIANAKQLLDSGAISQAEYEQLKAKALSS